MGYLRANGRFSGRVSGRWGGAFVRGEYGVGDTAPVDIGQTGLAPGVKGDMTTALIAQVNRFRKAQGSPAFPLATGTVPLPPALAALMILFERLTVASLKTPDDATLKQLDEVAKAQSDPVRYITPRIDVVTRQLALYGDSKGYPPATVGVTTSYLPKMSNTMAAVAIGALALGAAMLLGKKKKR